MKEGSIEEEGTHNELMGMDFFLCRIKKLVLKYFYQIREDSTTV